MLPDMYDKSTVFWYPVFLCTPLSLESMAKMSKIAKIPNCLEPYKSKALKTHLADSLNFIFFFFFYDCSFQLFLSINFNVLSWLLFFM